MDDKDFLGYGWRFPVQVDSATGRIKVSGAEENIAESIKIILNTVKGERVMRPDFGSELQAFAFEVLDLETKSKMSEEIKNSLILWEPRISDIAVTVSDKKREGCVDISVSYVVRNTNNPYNLVFPFYIDEGM